MPEVRVAFGMDKKVAAKRRIMKIRVLGTLIWVLFTFFPPRGGKLPSLCFIE
jgi:hypothetical protein